MPSKRKREESPPRPLPENTQTASLIAKDIFPALFREGEIGWSINGGAVGKVFINLEQSLIKTRQYLAGTGRQQYANDHQDGFTAVPLTPIMDLDTTTFGEVTKFATSIASMDAEALSKEPVMETDFYLASRPLCESCEPIDNYMANLSIRCSQDEGSHRTSLQDYLWNVLERRPEDQLMTAVQKCTKRYVDAQTGDPLGPLTRSLGSWAQLYYFGRNYNVKGLRSMALFRLQADFKKVKHNMPLIEDPTKCGSVPDIIALVKETFGPKYIPLPANELVDMVSYFIICIQEELCAHSEFLKLLTEDGRIGMKLFTATRTMLSDLD